jgi:branched-chain amino acid transport system permease protein
MSTVWLPCGDYHQDYAEDQGWWQTRFIKIKMILLLAVVFIGIPSVPSRILWVSVGTMVGYTAMGALGVQLLIGFAGLITLGHAAFIAVGAYTSTLLDSSISLARHLSSTGDSPTRSASLCSIAAGLWSVLFGLPSAKRQGILSDSHHHGRPVHHRGFHPHPVR